MAALSLVYTMVSGQLGCLSITLVDVSHTYLFDQVL